MFMLQLFWWASRPHNLCLRSRVWNKPVSVFESGVLSRPSSSPYIASLTKWATFESTSESTEPRVCELAIRNLIVGQLVWYVWTSKQNLQKGRSFADRFLRETKNLGTRLQTKYDLHCNTTKFAVWLNDFEYFFLADTFTLWSMEGLLTPRQGTMMQVSVCHWSKKLVKN